MAEKPRTIIGRGETLAAKARRSRKATAARRESTVRDYGEAMGGVAAQAFRPAEVRGRAGVQMAQARVGEARRLASATARSNRLFEQEGQVLDIAQAAQKQRVNQEARPQIISAKAAMASAEKYAQQIGINMKEMDWSAKAAIYQSIIDQNAEMFKMKFAQELEIDTQKQLFELQSEAARDAKLEGAPMVAQTVTSSMPGVIADLQEFMDGNIKGADGQPIETAPEFAQYVATRYTSDPNAQALLAGIAETLGRDAGRHITDGVLDGDWLRNTVTMQVGTFYPGYATASMSKALSNSVFGSSLAPSGEAGGKSLGPLQYAGALPWAAENLAKGKNLLQYAGGLPFAASKIFGGK